MKLTFIFISLMICLQLSAQNLNLKKIQGLEQQLDDVMELIDQDLVKVRLAETEQAFAENPSALNRLRCGLIYHEVALNLTFFDKTREYAGYAQKSYQLLTQISESPSTAREMRIYTESYRASALSLMAAETRKLKYLRQAFRLFESSVEKYAAISPRPAFMRGSVAENLPKILWRKRRFAKKDFQAIINNQDQNPDYADYRVMSFTYWAWARAFKGKKHRKTALEYLDRAIALDPEYQAGRKRAEELKAVYEAQK